jgi:hypothetical protein
VVTISSHFFNWPKPYVVWVKVLLVSEYGVYEWSIFGKEKKMYLPILFVGEFNLQKGNEFGNAIEVGKILLEFGYGPGFGTELH